MKGLMLPVLLGTLLLASCRPDPVPPLEVPSGESVLHGTWTGVLESDVNTSIRVMGEQRSYSVRTEGSQYNLPFIHSAQVRQVTELIAVTNGVITARKPLSSTYTPVSMAFRATQGEQPARLITVMTSYSGSTSAITVQEHDPNTLALTDTWTATQSTNNTSHFSLNPAGTRLELNDHRLIDTVTRQPVPLHPNITALLTSQPYDVNWSTDKNWLKVTTYEQKLLGKIPRYHFVSNETGKQQTGTPKHTPSPSCTSNGGPTDAWEITSLPDGGAALMYPDGVVELRQADGNLRQAVKLPACRTYWLTSDAEYIDYLDYSREPLGRIRIADGAVLAMPAMQEMPAQITHTLKLNTVATWESKTTYSFTGTADWDGKTHLFSGKAQSLGIELKPQTSPAPRYVAWTGQMLNADGSEFAKVWGTHGDSVPQQIVKVQLTGVEHDFSFNGPLQR